MNEVSLMKRLVVAVALTAGVSGLAHAGDMGRFGSSYAYFASQPIDKSPSAWRQHNPNGVSERTLQAYSGVSEVWDLNKPVFTNVASYPTFKQTHPNGLTEHEYQALSSEGPAWHSTPRLATSALVSETDSANATTAAK